MIDDVQERENLHHIEQTQSHGEAVGSMASRRRLMFWFETEIRAFVRVTIRRRICALLIRDLFSKQSAPAKAPAPI